MGGAVGGEGGGLIFRPKPSGGQGSSRRWEHLPEGVLTLVSALWAGGQSPFRPGRAGKSAWRLKGGLRVMGCHYPHVAQPAVLLPAKFGGQASPLGVPEVQGATGVDFVPRPT